jgi:hypothetical protein
MFDQFSLQSIDNSIEQRTMSIEIQPPVNLRPRYKSDGTRQIEKSRTKPMAIKVCGFFLFLKFMFCFFSYPI